MKLSKEDKKTIKQLKKMYKTSLFMPLFYTFFYGLALIGAIALPSEVVKHKWIIIIVLVLFLTLTWTMYKLEKKHDKDVKEEVDEIIYNIEHDLENEDEIDDEEMNLVKKKLLSIDTFSIWTVVSSSLFSLVIVFKDILPVGQILLTIIFIFLGLITSIFFIISLVKYLKMKSYSK